MMHSSKVGKNFPLRPWKGKKMFDMMVIMLMIVLIIAIMVAAVIQGTRTRAERAGGVVLGQEYIIADLLEPPKITLNSHTDWHCFHELRTQYANRARYYEHMLCLTVTTQASLPTSSQARENTLLHHSRCETILNNKRLLHDRTESDSSLKSSPRVTLVSGAVCFCSSSVYG